MRRLHDPLFELVCLALMGAALGFMLPVALAVVIMPPPHAGSDAIAVLIGLIASLI